MKTLWLLICFLSMASLCYADRDIVFAARYYVPPSSHRTSHFHLYRINPDGTGKTQITFGPTDDTDPKWSPDGKYIVFLRENAAGQTTLCLIKASGSALRTLLPPEPASTEDEYGYHWSPDGRLLAVVHEIDAKVRSSVLSLLSTKTWQVTRRFVGVYDAFWSPDSRQIFLDGEVGCKIFSLSNGTETPLAVSMCHPVWLNNQTLVGITGDDPDKPMELSFINRDGQEEMQTALIMPGTYQGFERTCGDRLQMSLPATSWLVYALNNHNSTVGTDYLFFLANIKTGEMQYLTEGQFLAWSPDGSRFCTAPGRDTTSYEKRAGRDDRTVWAAPLYVRKITDGPMRALTPRLSWVTGADWRKDK